MSELEKMKVYVDRTKINKKSKMRLGLNINEAIALYDASKNASSIDAVWELFCLAFNYGMAKGYRAAKKESAK